MDQESLLNILMYVFEHYIDEPTFAAKTSGKAIVNEMARDGFNAYEIDRALDWFGELNEIQSNVIEDYKNISNDSIRVLTDYETNHITPAAHRCLLQLEQTQIIDSASKELILDRVMALGAPIVDVPEIKWVAVLVLFNQPEKYEQMRMLEELILFGDECTRH